MSVREQIKQIEQDLEVKLNVDKIKPYGSNNQGYKQLREYHSRNGSINNTVRKRLHEYRAFLAVLDLIADPEDVEDRVFFKPTTGKGYQLATASSIFVEPSLPVYPEKKVWKQHKLDYSYLQKPENDGSQRHTIPDILITKSDTDRLPWSKRTDAPVIDESRLQKMCANFAFDIVEDRLNTDQTISTYSECLSAIQSHAQRKNPTKLYEQWEDFQSDARYIIESKHNRLDEDDYSQILWYGIAYKTPLIIISQESITNQQFRRDIENLPVPVNLIENFNTTITIERARQKLSMLSQLY